MARTLKPPVYTQTPRYRIYSAMRKLWLWSNERAYAIRRDKYTCQECGVKQSRKKGQEQKIHVHHIKGSINWNKIIEQIRKELLVRPDHLQSLCPRCHSRHR